MITDKEFEDRFGETREEAIERERSEFASLGLGEQLHIARALVMARQGPRAAYHLTAAIAAFRGLGDNRTLRAVDQMMATTAGHQYRVEFLDELRSRIPRDGEASANARLIELLVFAAIAELDCDLIESFDAYRFLYERIVGPDIRPFLAAAFLGAVTLPRWDMIWQRRMVATVNSWDFQGATPPQFFPTEPSK